MNRILPRGFAVWVLGIILIGNTVRGDLSVLGVTGPQSGSVFSNIGVVTSKAVFTTMEKADVLIELQKLEGDVLTATCTAVFDLETDYSTPKEGQSLWVAFPVTGIGGAAVKITQFEAVVDGYLIPDLKARTIQLVSESDVAPLGVHDTMNEFKGRKT